MEDIKDSLSNLLTVFFTSTELRNVLSDSINLFRDLFADSAELVAQAAISTTRASKQAAQKARPSEDERHKGTNGIDKLLKMDSSDAKNLRKKVARGIEDVKDDAERSLMIKTRKVRTFLLSSLSVDLASFVADDTILLPFRFLSISIYCYQLREYVDEELPSDAKDALIERFKAVRFSSHFRLSPTLRSSPFRLRLGD